ncbi:hypothetical protein [Brucella pituitosa]|uniref:hypothetical protein n=1 Tax=Brucella pituitosa TaxID=571256 RepID=UPI0009A15EC2|nr:hypothetical protein [Brucella pituitosa]
MIKNAGIFISGIFFVIIGLAMLCIHSLITGLNTDFGTGAVTGLAFGIGAGALLFRTIALDSLEKND